MMNYTDTNIEDMRARIDNSRVLNRSAWGRGVTTYAHEILDTLGEVFGGYVPADVSAGELEVHALNGARDWSQYSWGGCSLIYDEDIAKTLCTPSELKKTRGGERRPNAREEWLDTQARALRQDFRRVNGARVRK